MSAPAQVRPWLVLARASNLPTVWSNCIAGCWLGGWSSGRTVLLLCIAATLLYTAGMFLNDFCDVGFDRQYKRARPIIAGELTRPQVGLAALIFFIAGLAFAWTIAPKVLLFAALLVIAIIGYDFLHKRIAWAPVLMATCRFLLYLMAATAGILGLTKQALGFGVGLGFYVVGLSYLARGESRTALKSGGWLALLFAPILLNLYFRFSWLSLVCTVPLLLWILHALLVARENIGRGVSALLAGIVLVDLVAIGPAPLLMWIVFGCLFGAALLFQRYVPAT